MESVKIPPAFMPMPKGCGRGAHPVFDGKICVDTVICQFYCTESCLEYVAYDQERMRAGKERRERSKEARKEDGSGRRDLDFETDRIEASEKPKKRKGLEL